MRIKQVCNGEISMELVSESGKLCNHMYADQLGRYDEALKQYYQQLQLIPDYGTTYRHCY